MLKSFIFLFCMLVSAISIRSDGASMVATTSPTTTVTSHSDDAFLKVAYDICNRFGLLKRTDSRNAKDAQKIQENLNSYAMRFFIKVFQTPTLSSYNNARTYAQQKYNALKASNRDSSVKSSIEAAFMAEEMCKSAIDPNSPSPEVSKYKAEGDAIILTYFGHEPGADTTAPLNLLKTKIKAYLKGYLEAKFPQSLNALNFKPS